MSFEFPEYIAPDFDKPPLVDAPEVSSALVEADGVAPDNYHATSIYPEYFRLGSRWVLAPHSRMDCLAVLGQGGSVEIKEFRRLKKGERVVVGRSEDGSEGIYVHENGFRQSDLPKEKFAFRTSDSRETSKAWDYDKLYDILRHEKDKGYIVWVLGPAVSFDQDARQAMSGLIEEGYVHAILAGNALATHDLEAAIFRTALGQGIYNRNADLHGHYHHLDVLNRARRAGSIEALLEEGVVRDGIIHTCLKNGVQLVLAPSIRDDGPLPEVCLDVSQAQDEMREHASRATTVIALATQLHTIAVGNMTPSYQIVRGKVRPVFFYAVDMSEFVLNKLRDRGSLEVATIATNVHDFLFILRKGLLNHTAGQAAR